MSVWAWGCPRPPYAMMSARACLPQQALRTYRARLVPLFLAHSSYPAPDPGAQPLLSMNVGMLTGAWDAHGRGKDRPTSGMWVTCPHWTPIDGFSREGSSFTEFGVKEVMGSWLSLGVRAEDHRKAYFVGGRAWEGAPGSHLPLFPSSSRSASRNPQASALRPLCEAMTSQQCGLKSLT